MDVGIAFIFQNFEDKKSDAEVWRRDLEVASWLEDMGYDYIGAVEHHFFSYAMLPDNFSFLAYMAGKTKRIKLMTAAVILPWNDPLRVVEKLIQLDHLSDGRLAYGMGRGLARREYEHFGIDMNEARGRFDEASKLILDGLETGIVKGDGQYYKIPPTEVRPRPRGSFKGRTFAVAMSSDSIPVCAELGATMMAFATKPWEKMVDQINTYKSLFQQHHKTPVPTPMFCNFMFCDSNGDRAAELANKYMGRYYDCLMDHYEMASSHWESTKGYGDYAANAEAIAKLESYEQGKAAYVSVNDFGTPNQMLEEYERRRRLLGDFDLIINPTFGNMPIEDVHSSLKLFSTKILPELKSWKMSAA